MREHSVPGETPTARGEAREHQVPGQTPTATPAQAAASRAGLSRAEDPLPVRPTQFPGEAREGAAHPTMAMSRPPAPRVRTQQPHGRLRRSSQLYLAQTHVRPGETERNGPEGEGLVLSLNGPRKSRLTFFSARRGFTACHTGPEIWVASYFCLKGRPERLPGGSSPGASTLSGESVSGPGYPLEVLMMPFPLMKAERSAFAIPWIFLYDFLSIHKGCLPNPVVLFSSCMLKFHRKSSSVAVDQMPSACHTWAVCPPFT